MTVQNPKIVRYSNGRQLGRETNPYSKSLRLKKSSHLLWKLLEKILYMKRMYFKDHNPLDHLTIKFASLATEEVMTELSWKVRG